MYRVRENFINESKNFNMHGKLIFTWCFKNQKKEKLLQRKSKSKIKVKIKNNNEKLIV